MSSYGTLSRKVAFLGGLLVALAAGVAFSGGDQGATRLKAVPLTEVAAEAAAVQKAADERSLDREGIQKAVDGFVQTYGKGDAKALASLWTSEGEYIEDDGTTVRGRPALEKAYAEFFMKNRGSSLEVEVDQIRFPSRDNAILEGHFKLRKGATNELIISRCSFLYAREDGKWLIAIAREWPSDGVSLRDLEWLIGTWEVKRDGITVTTKYTWTPNKSFIRCDFSIQQDGKRTEEIQIYGKDPSLNTLRSWTFAHDGGIGDTDISRDGKKWIFSARGVTAEGRVILATNMLTPVDADTFLWQSVERSSDGESLPDLPPVKVTRVKSKP